MPIPIALDRYLPAPVVTSMAIRLPGVTCHRNHVLIISIRICSEAAIKEQHVA
jgi:hypothetical protein